MSTTFEATDLVRAGMRLVRARLGFYLGAYTLCFLPIMLVSAASLALQADGLRAIFEAAMDGRVMPIPAESGAATGLQLLSYALMIVGMPAYAAVATRAALDQLDGTERGLVETLQACGKPILWMMVLDTALAVVNYFGCFCCCVPGLALAAVVVAFLSLQTAILCDRPVDWIVAASESRTLSRPHVGTLFAATSWYGLLWVLWVALAAACAVGTFALGIGGGDVGNERVLETAVAAYGAMVVISFVPGALLTTLWFTFRAVLYHRIVRPAGTSQLQQVFG